MDREMMPRPRPRQGADKKPLPPLSSSTILRCAFDGGDERGGFTGEQLRYPCKLRRHICARCGMHRGEHGRPYAGIGDDHLPPRKRSVFRRLLLGEFRLPDLGGGEHGRPYAGIRDDHLPPRKRSVFRRLLGEFQLPDLGGGDDDRRERQLAWTPGDAIAKGKRGARRRRAAWCEL